MLSLAIYQKEKLISNMKVPLDNIVAIGGDKCNDIIIPVMPDFKGIFIPESENYLYYQDIVSSYKTQINGKAVYHGRLVNGDVIEFGDIRVNIIETMDERQDAVPAYEEPFDAYRPVDMTDEDEWFGKADPKNVVFLYKCSRLFLENADAEDTLDIFAKQLKNQFGLNRIVIATFGMSGRLETHVWLAPDDFSLSRTILNKMISLNKMVFSDNAMEDTDFKVDGKTVLSISKSQIKSVAMIPLRQKGEVYGVLYVDRNPAKAFQEPELSLLVLLSEYTSNHILNHIFRQRPNQNDIKNQTLEHAYITIHKKNRDILAKLPKIIQSEGLNVLLLGESGVGKDQLARLIHYYSKRCHKPFLTVNCAAIPESLFESEFFGTSRGAYTSAINRRGYFEQAEGGTLFLDEFAEMSPALQAKFLSVLETKKIKRVGGEKEIDVDFRLITATNQDIRQKLKEGNFRRDLYHRINGIEIHLTPLRKRREDIAVLMAYFLYLIRRNNLELDVNRFHDSAVEMMMKYDWPGNIRALHVVIERAVRLSDHKTIHSKDLRLEVEESVDLLTMEEMKKKHFLRVLKSTNYNKRKTSRILGITPQSVYDNMKKYNLLGSDSSLR
jgi:transcriptional regulator with GAF, ATPase, and Fis domain